MVGITNADLIYPQIVIPIGTLIEYEEENDFRGLMKITWPNEYMEKNLYFNFVQTLLTPIEWAKIK